jgi:hypothetical protein
VKDTFAQVLAREKRAGKERLALENQLKVESRERRRQVSHTEEAETRIRDEFTAIMKDSDAHTDMLRAEAREKCAAEDAVYQELEIALAAQLAQLQVQLADVQKDTRRRKQHCARRCPTTRRSSRET